MPNLDAAILDALHRDGGCQDQLLRGAKGVQKEHAHQALTAQGGRRAAAGRTWSAGPLPGPAGGPDRLRCPSVADLHAVGAHDLNITQLQAQRANHACCMVAKGMH